MSIRVVIADDHPVLLAGMEHMLSGVRGIVVAGLVRDSTELVDLLGRQAADVVVTDFSMPQGRYGDGIALLRFLRRRFPQVRLAVLTSVESPWVLRSILEVDVHVIVSKADPHDCLETAIRAAHGARGYLSPEARRLIEQAAGSEAEQGASLTKRETEVLRMFAEGLSVAEIGARVGRSRKTVSTQKMAAMRKLGLERDAEVFQYAVAHGLIQASQQSRSHAAGEDEPA